jgi:hypothetical protein
MRFRISLAATTLTAVGVIVGCQQHHYVVREDGAPLYAAEEGEQVLTHMRRYAHARLDEEPEAADSAERVRVVYDGQVGYAPREAVRTFSYLDPAWDEGAARQSAISTELRTLRLEDVAGDWSDETKTAIRHQRLVEGMTRDQVEVALGWPHDVGRDGESREVWYYQELGVRHIEELRELAPMFYQPGWSTYYREPLAVPHDLSGPYFPRFPSRVPVTVVQWVRFQGEGVLDWGQRVYHRVHSDQEAIVPPEPPEAEGEPLSD